jgi:hypothetical protein
MLPGHIDCFSFDSLFHRMMRRTGRLYTLTLVSASLSIVSAVYIFLWDPNTSEFHLWLDLVPCGSGVASMITSTLIVSPTPGTFRFLTLVIITGHDRECVKGGCRGRHRDHVSFPDDRSSPWSQLEWGTSSDHPHEATSEANHGTWVFRGLILASFVVSQLTAYHCYRRLLNESNIPRQ